MSSGRIDDTARPSSGEQARSSRVSEERDLRESLRGLAGLTSDALSLQDLLTRVATFAAQAIPGADGAGVTLLKANKEKNEVQALAASARFVSEIDTMQYHLIGEGPCITAAREQQTVRSGWLAKESRWPEFGPRVSALGVHSVLSLPLPVSDRVVGAINVYALEKDAFDDHAQQLGELFAAPAAVAVQNAQVLAQALLVAAHLQTSLDHRTAVDQALGILRSRSGASLEGGLDQLHEMSKDERVSMAVIAQRIVDEAVDFANERHDSDS